MFCNELVRKIDDYLDGDLAAQDVSELTQHANNCKSCGELLNDRQRLSQSLADLPVENPDPDFFATALDHATRATTSERSWFDRSSRAIAAVAAVLLIAGVALKTPVFNPSSDIPHVAITLHEVTPVNLRFASEADLVDARLSLQLPDGVELAGYTGRRALSWRTDLQKGDNLLRLPLLGNMASTDRLIAELDHPDGSKTFELQITVN